MSRILMVLASTFVLSTMAHAATVEGGANGNASDALKAKAKAVCAGEFVLTADAMAACKSEVWPLVLADGSRFRATGIGAEFNTLIRQLKTDTAAIAAKPAN